MYRSRGFGDVVDPSGVGAPPATVSQYALPNCGWGQKTVGNGPFTCQFDIATAVSQAWAIPGTYLSVLAPSGLIPSGTSPNAIYALGWGVVLAAGWFMFGRGGGRGR
jgi:hypothetical protein